MRLGCAGALSSPPLTCTRNDLWRKVQGGRLRVLRSIWTTCSMGIRRRRKTHEYILSKNLEQMIGTEEYRIEFFSLEIGRSHHNSCSGREMEGDSTMWGKRTGLESNLGLDFCCLLPVVLGKSLNHSEPQFPPSVQ